MVEVNRRTGLAALVGSMFAGPEVAKQLASEVSLSDAIKSAAQVEGSVGTRYKPSPADIAEKETANIRYTRKRIAKLKRIVNGDFTQEEDDYDHDYDEPQKARYDGIECAVDALKSVSPAGKRMLKNRKYYERDLEERKNSAARELNRMMRSWAKSTLWGKVSDLFK